MGGDEVIEVPVSCIDLEELSRDELVAMLNAKGIPARHIIGLEGKLGVATGRLIQLSSPFTFEVIFRWEKVFAS